MIERMDHGIGRIISKLTEKGGGKLVVPPGIWLTGPIKLRSNIDLHVERGALIRFSGDCKLYPLTVLDIKDDQVLLEIYTEAGIGTEITL